MPDEHEPLIAAFLYNLAAKQNGFDVVLIDTAGRMQDNEPLMRALAKVRCRESQEPHAARASHRLTPFPVTLHSCCICLLAIITHMTYVAHTHAQLIAVNQPDKIIFVGEALVGNEAVDQLTKFNRSLRDFSARGGRGAGSGSTKGKGEGRGVDGMILTKFDTIDDKVRSIASW